MSRLVSKRLLAIALFCLTGLWTSQALSLGVCTLVASDGTLAASPDFTHLSSANSGGVHGTVTATVVGLGVTIQLLPPAVFTSAPSGGNTNISFSTQMTGTGATLISLTVGTTPISLLAGITTANIDLTATKSSGVITAGSYLADLTVRCQ